MASSYRVAYKKSIEAEGGFKLEEVEGDYGGQTYAGISRRYWPNWEGWELIDRGIVSGARLEGMVFVFYRKNFWNKTKVGFLSDQDMAECIFDYAINKGVRSAILLVQASIRTETTGKMNRETVNKLNSMSFEQFSKDYTLGKIAMYVHRVMDDRSQEKFFLGWVRRALLVGEDE